jgi:lysophospholipase L1-like esterase
VLAGWRAGLGGAVALVGLAVAFAPAGAGAAPLITGCCDSLTTVNYTNPGYLPLVDDVYDYVYSGGNVHDQAVAARTSAASLTALQTHLATNNPESVVVLSGTPDLFFTGPGYDPNTTIGSVAAMVVASQTDLAVPILVAPPPVLDPCPPTGGLTCAQIDSWLAYLSGQYHSIAAYYDVAFIDLYARFEEQLPYVDLYGENGGDGVHPSDEGDQVIAQAVLDELAEVVGAPCGDGVDNDGDGFVDFPADAGCDDASDWSEGVPVLECDDGIDNDGDGASDLEDFGCHSRGDLSENTAPNVIICDDGIDNDGDGAIDFPEDPGCGHPVQMTTEGPACNDGLDNDLDGLIDFDGGQSIYGECTGGPGGCPPEVSDPEGDGVANPDPQCGSGSMAGEAPASRCGLGFEVGLLLAPLLWWHRRRTIRR